MANKFNNRDLVKIDWDSNNTLRAGITLPNTSWKVGIVQHALSDASGPYCVIVWYKTEADIKKISSSLNYSPLKMNCREDVLKLYYSIEDKINDLFKDLEDKYGKV